MSREVVARAADVAPGTCKIVTVAGREVGIYNIKGEYFALANRCPHGGADLCKGRIGGLVTSGGPNQYKLTRPGEFVRCPWHGWEYDIRTGQSYCDPQSVRVKQFRVTVEPGEEIAKGPYVVETFPVSVEEDYLVVDTVGSLADSKKEESKAG